MEHEKSYIGYFKKYAGTIVNTVVAGAWLVLVAIPVAGYFQQEDYNGKVLKVVTLAAAQDSIKDKLSDAEKKELSDLLGLPLQNKHQFRRLMLGREVPYETSDNAIAYYENK